MTRVNTSTLSGNWFVWVNASELCTLTFAGTTPPERAVMAAPRSPLANARKSAASDWCWVSRLMHSPLTSAIVPLRPRLGIG